MKIIKYFRKSNYGNSREYICRENGQEKLMICYLTGKLTIDENVRRWIETLTDNTIRFEEVIEPK